MISVIVPVYNVQTYLEKCLNSIINQSYKDLEIILVNDGSTDGCGDICNKYAILDKRIKVIHQKNAGLSDARNSGLKIATGEYIAFLDSDDWVDKELYETLYNEINRHDADIAICRYKYSYNEQEELVKLGNSEIYSNLEILESMYTKDYGQIIVAWNKLYKREVFQNMYYPKGKIHEDEFLTPFILYKAKKIVFVEDELIYYRQTNNSIMNSKFSINRLDKLEALAYRMSFFKKEGLKSLYDKTVIAKLECIMEYYYIIVNSDIIDQREKEIFIEILNNRLKEDASFRFKSLPLKQSLKKLIFEINPKLYKKIIEIKKRSKKLH